MIISYKKIYSGDDINKKKYIRVMLLATYLLPAGITSTISAQDTIPVTSADTLVAAADSVFVSDTMVLAGNSAIAAFDSTFLHHEDSAFAGFPDSTTATVIPADATVTKKDAISFKPNPKTADLVAAIFPGLGQFYNRQYWKLPIVYGGLMGCAYAITWNNKTYQDYKRAYFDIMADAKADPNGIDPESWRQSWQDYTSSDADAAAKLHNTTFHNTLKNRKDYYLRYRDLSIIIGLGLYLIFIADAHVDAQMFDFDVSPDLSFRLTPEFRPETLACSHSFGVNICMTF
ncbi:MAG: DUF5683 domain-containing protein [Tannerella sp.]|jgi:hypothetical protein|nr:DUF5683 domain-containing protein [Tannerella sp.]